MVRRVPSGFTLLEVVAALAIIALVGISALTAVGQQTRSAAYAQAMARATSLAEERLEVIPLLTAGQVQALPDTMAAGRFPAPDNDYSWRMTSTPFVNELNLNDVRIEVRWSGGSFALRTRVYAPVDSLQ